MKGLPKVIGIPLEEAMAMIDSDYASKPQSCGDETEKAPDTADRHKKSGLGVGTKKVVGVEWRSPDVSK